MNRTANIGNRTSNIRNLNRLVASTVAALTVCALVSVSPAEAATKRQLQPVRPLRPQGVVVPNPEPRYVVKATSFYAGDETGFDNSGSDEPYWIFSSHGTDGRTVTTSSHTFGDVDSGDTRSFPANEGCLWSHACTSTPAPRGIGFTVQLWEEELGQAEEVKAKTKAAFADAGDVLALLPLPGWADYLDEVVGFVLSWAADDHVDTERFYFSQAELAKLLPAAGQSFEVVRHFSGDDGYGYSPADYDLRIEVRRVA